MSNNYEFISTEIDGLYVINPFHASDDRGFVKKTFERNIFLKNNIDFNPVEEMETISKKNVIRGLHFQISNPQAKLVRCAKGEILDVVVDLRKDSMTFGKSFSILLSSENKKMLYIPKGFAHGVKILLDDTIFYYLSDDRYYPEYDSGILWNDQELAIDWETDNIEEIILSGKDENLQTFQEFKKKYGGL
ncbi:dTDP-4-dehydrorhamnose 3,5-epimerase [Psychrobacillus psychrodurans]|uniref:dTDP-4-dehydrorhamnose 3,5-epimerase n=1 Tax=Psychrobacillus psychrodurans TaxID=126157 RepID=A0A9X3L5Y8_9BACI|nr:dTDP-4-dehydrorhamnose 3,5-epimerase [Psychrobacillus psychrodurans]MCZ8532012.1 dTDP-4-dehydrorhamnose 3,5-epimerase [Psychrobacillus psychrodurans]